MTLNLNTTPPLTSTLNDADAGDVDFAAILARATAAQPAAGSPPLVDLDPSATRSEYALGTVEAGDFNMEALIQEIVQNSTPKEVPTALSPNAIALNPVQGAVGILNAAVKELEYSLEKEVGNHKVKISVSIPDQSTFVQDPQTGETKFDIMYAIGSAADIRKAKIKIEIVESPKNDAGKAIKLAYTQSIKAEYDVAKGVFNLTWVEESDKWEPIKTDWFKVSGSVKGGVDLGYFDPTNTNNGSWSIEKGLGIAVKVAGVGNVFAAAGQNISRVLAQLGWTSLTSTAATGPAGVATGATAFLGSVAVGEFTKGWDFWVGLKLNAKLSVDQGLNPENIFVEVSGQKLTLAQVLNGANYLKNEILRSNDTIGRLAAVFNIIPEADGPSLDDNLIALFGPNVQENQRQLRTDFLLKADLDGNGDALSIHGKALEISNTIKTNSLQRQEMAKNAVDIQRSNDPRMFIASFFERAFYTTKVGISRNIDWTTPLSRNSVMNAGAYSVLLPEYRTQGVGEYTIRNIPRLLDKARRDAFKADNGGTAAVRNFDLRFKAFAERVVSEGYVLDYPGDANSEIGQIWTNAFNDAKKLLKFDMTKDAAKDAVAVNDYFKKGANGGLKPVQSSYLNDIKAEVEEKKKTQQNRVNAVSINVAGVFSNTVQSFVAGSREIEPLRSAVGVALAAGATKEDVLAAISAEVFGGISTASINSSGAQTALAQRIAAAPALDSAEMEAIRQVLKQTGLDADFAKLDDTSTEAFRGLSSDQVMNIALLQAAFETKPSQVALLKTFDVSTGRTLASAIASIQSGTNAAASTEFLTAVAQNLERGLGTNDKMLLAMSQVLPTRNLVASVKGYAADSNDAVFFAGEKFDKLPDSSKVQFNNDYAGYKSYRTGVKKEPATEQQRTAFRDAYIETFARGGTSTVAYNAAKLAADKLDAPLEFKSSVRGLEGNEAATTRFKMADLVPAFTSLGTPVYSLSGADAAKFEVVDGVLYLKAGTVLDKTAIKKLDVSVAVTYPSAGTKPGIWKGPWPPTGSALFTIGLVGGVIALPEISGAPKAGVAAQGWTITGGTPDLIVKNGNWPGNSVTQVLDMGSRSPSGGAVALFIDDPIGNWNENITTTVTGLIAGQTYELAPIYWQQIAIGGDYDMKGAGRLVVKVDGIESVFEPNGTVTDDKWQTATVRFVAKGNTATVNLRAQTVNSPASAVIAVDIGPALTTNSAPTEVLLKNQVTEIPATVDTKTKRKIADVKPFDDDKGTNTIKLSGPDAAMFELLDGAVYLKAGVDLAAKGQASNPNLVFDLTVQDSSLPVTTAITKRFNLKVNQTKAPTGVTIPNGLAISKNASGQFNVDEDRLTTTFPTRDNEHLPRGLAIGEIKATGSQLGKITYTLSGADAAMFEIFSGTEYNVPPTLYLKPGVVLDHETNPTLDVTITATDPNFPSSPVSANFTIVVNDKNDAPLGVNFANAMTTLNMVSDITTRTKVADVSAIDDSFGNNRFSLSGADAELFELVDGKLFLKAGLAINAATKPSLSVIVSVKDDNINKPAVSKTFAIAVANTNAAPTAIALTPVVTRIVENTPVLVAQEVATIAIADDGFGTNAITLTGTDAALFEVVGNKLMLKAGTVVDFEQRSVLSVTVNVDDAGRGNGVDASATYSIDVQDINDAPTTIEMFNVETVLSRATPLEIPLKIADLVIDSDALGTDRIQLVGSDADKFMVVDNKLYLKAGTVLDYTTKPVFNVTILVDDPTLLGSSLVRKIFRIDVAPPGGFASVYGRFVFDTMDDQHYILWPDGRQQAIIYSEDQRTGEPILTDKLTMTRLPYIKAPDGEFYVRP